MVSPWHALDGQVQSRRGRSSTQTIWNTRDERRMARKRRSSFEGSTPPSRVHCHKIIKLSGAVQDFARSITVNVHGVSPHFIGVGRKIAEATDTETSSFSKGGYFIGKVVWAKGYLELLERVAEYNETAASENQLALDVFGDGDDFKDVIKTAARQKLPLTFHGRADHAGRTRKDTNSSSTPRCLTSSPPPQRRLSRWANSWFALVILPTSSSRRSQTAARTPPGRSLPLAFVRCYTLSQAHAGGGSPKTHLAGCN